MSCVLCDSLHEEFRLVKETKHSFCVVCKDSLKKGHLLIMPKKHVTQHEFSHLGADETHDFFSLIEFMQAKLNNYSDEDVILFKNSGKHSSQAHFHFHLLPSKVGLRELISSFEGVPEREEKPLSYYEEVRDEMLALFK